MLNRACFYEGILLASLLVSNPSWGGELTHGFVNPDFGGSPLNGAYLLSNASAQNDHTPKTPTSALAGLSGSAQKNSAELFAEQVNSLVMSSVAYRVVNQAFGQSGPLPNGSSLNTGINTVSVDYYDGGVRVTVIDNKTGGRSVIDIPNY
jgi:curli production assembly/transport component CsgF